VPSSATPSPHEAIGDRNEVGPEDAAMKTLKSSRGVTTRRAVLKGGAGIAGALAMPGISA